VEVSELPSAGRTPAPSVCASNTPGHHRYDSELGHRRQIEVEAIGVFFQRGFVDAALTCDALVKNACGERNEGSAVRAADAEFPGQRDTAILPY